MSAFVINFADIHNYLNNGKDKDMPYLTKKESMGYMNFDYISVHIIHNGGGEFQRFSSCCGIGDSFEKLFDQYAEYTGISTRVDSKLVESDNIKTPARQKAIVNAIKSIQEEAKAKLHEWYLVYTDEFFFKEKVPQFDNKGVYFDESEEINEKRYQDLLTFDKYKRNLNSDIFKAESLHVLFSSIPEKTNKKQFVITGAPGTGKTYNIENHFKTCIKNVGNTDVLVWDAYFKNLLTYYESAKQKKDSDYNSATGVCKITDDTYSAAAFVKDKSSPKLKDCYKFVQFHSSYDYTDFVEGLRPVVIGYDDTKPVTQFVRLDGTFKAFCRKAVQYPYLNFAFVIDEINRADLSRVFGEIMYCLEESKRGPRHRITTQYSNLPTYEKGDDANGNVVFKPMDEKDDVFKDGFYIPENVYIFATMNDIDRSVETFDFALRRRFQWVEVAARDTLYTALKDIPGAMDQNGKRTQDFDNLLMRATLLNVRIAEQTGLGREYQLGQSYFRDYVEQEVEQVVEQEAKQEVKEKGQDAIKKYFDSHLKPILSEYVRGMKDAETFIKECEEQFALTTDLLVQGYQVIDDKEKPLDEKGEIIAL